MREITHKKRQSLQKRRKVISICETSKEKDYTTRVRKNFVYIVNKTRALGIDPQAPIIHIKKQINSKTGEEKFHFRVKGSFYMVQDDTIFKVYFRHSLNILIKWKSKKFSPKKSAMLT